MQTTSAKAESRAKSCVMNIWPEPNNKSAHVADPEVRERSLRHPQHGRLTEQIAGF
jgi:hypothetical protein